MKIFILIFLVITSSVHAKSNNLICNKVFNEITQISPIKDSSPSVIVLEVTNNQLKSFIWDTQKLEMHFEILMDNYFDLKIGSKGYSDINNAVFFELNKDVGYFYQYSIGGVSYRCTNNK